MLLSNARLLVDRLDLPLFRPPKTQTRVLKEIAMKLKTLSLGAASLLFALVSQAPQSGTIHQGLPPLAVSRTPVTSWMPVGGSMVGSVVIRTTDQEIQIHWEGYAGTPFDSPKTQFVVQTHAVSFWPTAVEVVDTTTILVAGKEPRSHNTKIEKWTLAPPTYGAPLGGSSATQGLILQPVISKEVIYNEATVGRDMVQFIMDVQGPGSNALVRFYDSGDVYQLDWGTAPYAITRFATASGATGSEMEIPELLGTFDGASRGDHKVDGYMHWMYHDASMGGDPVVAFIDLDRDGVIDVFEIFTPPNWATDGHGREVQWVEFEGRTVQQ